MFQRKGSCSKHYKNGAPGYTSIHHKVPREENNFVNAPRQETVARVHTHFSLSRSLATPLAICLYVSPEPQPLIYLSLFAVISKCWGMHTHHSVHTHTHCWPVVLVTQWAAMIRGPRQNKRPDEYVLRPLPSGVCPLSRLLSLLLPLRSLSHLLST